MPPVDALDSPNAARLRIGQGVRGGAASLASNRQPARGLPEVPTGLPHIRNAGTGINMGAVAAAAPVAHVGVPNLLSPSLSAPVDVMHPGESVAPQYRGQALLHRFGNQAAFGNLDDGKPMAPAEKKAFMAIAQPDKHYDPTDHVTNAVILNPGPKLQNLITQNPALQQNHEFLRQHIAGNALQQTPAPAPPLPPGVGPRGRNIGTSGLQQLQTETAAASAPAESAYKKATGGFQLAPVSETPTDLNTLHRSAQQEAGLIPYSPAAIVPKLGSEVANTLVGAGPGLYHLAGGMIHDPVGTTAKLAEALGHSYGQTIHHPLRQLSQDPLGFITNALTPMFLAAGAGARVAELTRTAEALRTGEITKLQAVTEIGKTLMRPATAQRNIEVNGVRVSPPAFKSALGGYAQTKLLDPLTERAARMSLNRGQIRAVGREFKVGDQIQGLLPEGKVGAMTRRDTEMQMQQRRGMAEAKLSRNPAMPKDEVQRRSYAIGAAQTHLDVWHSLYHGGAGFTESYEHDPNGFVAVRRPPDGVKATAYTSEQGIARQFKSMVETNPKKIEAAPHDYSFIPKGTWQRMQLYRPGTGALSKAADVVDRGTQMIRLGRFLHPGYLAWAVQNGVLHASQAGMFAFRNAWQLRNEYPRMTDVEKAAFDNGVGAGHFGGGIARATQGSETSKFSNLSAKLGGFWHKVDDSYWRRMSLIHELNHAGYHSAEDWAHLMRTDPTRFRTIARQAQREAIDYSEMSPTERATLQKLFTAYGWTRGASTFTARFALQHPVQARLGEEIGREGNQQTENFYSGHNGMVPNWLRGFLPVGHSNHPFLISGGILNPAETLGRLIEETPGATQGQTESLSSEFAPIPSGLEELARGQDRYGNALKGNARVTQPATDVLKRFEPLSALENLTGSKHGGGTTVQGPGPAAEQFMGVPVSQLSDADKTAALGMKDYEQALDKPDQINFRYDTSLSRLPGELQLFHQHTGQAPAPALVSKIKGDLEAVHQRDMYQYNYAKSVGSKSWRSLSATNKATGTLAFMVQHRYIHPQQVAQLQQTLSTLKDDKQIEDVVSQLWQDTGIGAVANEWQNSMKTLKPAKLTPPRH